MTGVSLGGGGATDVVGMDFGMNAFVDGGAGAGTAVAT